MRGKNRKGQLVFEFLIAAVFFFYIVFYVINYLNTTALVFENDFYMNSLEFKALQTSELLLHSKGTWNGTVPKALGLVEDWPVLSSTKIQNMNAYCNSNYTDLLEKLDVNSSLGHGIKIEINKSDVNLLECGYLPEGTGWRFVSANIERFALSDSDEVLTLSVWAW